MDLNKIRTFVIDLTILVWILTSAFFVYYYIKIGDVIMASLDTINLLLGAAVVLVSMRYKNIKIISMWGLSPFLCFYALISNTPGEVTGALYGYLLATGSFFLFGVKKGFIAYSLYLVLFTGYFLNVLSGIKGASDISYSLDFKISYTVIYIIVGTYSYLAEKALQKILNQIKDM